jgi:serine/threonine-protein kinase HipA
LLAATDGHAKNFSLRWSFEGFSLAPLYDIISVQPLIDQGHLQIEKVKMSMAIGKKRSYKTHQIFRRHFLQTAELCRFDTNKMNEIIDEVLLQLPLAIQKVSSNLPGNFPKPLAHSIFQGMKKRSQQF